MSQYLYWHTGGARGLVGPPNLDAASQFRFSRGIGCVLQSRIVTEGNAPTWHDYKVAMFVALFGLTKVSGKASSILLSLEAVR